MVAIRLIGIDDELARAAAQGRDSLAKHFDVRIGDYWPDLSGCVDQTISLYQRLPRPKPWIGYLALGEENFIVGGCGFVTAPNEGRAVEIAYGVFPPFQRRGYGTALARALIDIATRSGIVAVAFAHTLPENNASARILRRVGMTCVGEFLHPEDGKVWRWELPLKERPAQAPKEIGNDDQ